MNSSRGRHEIERSRERPATSALEVSDLRRDVLSPEKIDGVKARVGERHAAAAPALAGAHGAMGDHSQRVPVRLDRLVKGRRVGLIDVVLTREYA